MPCKSLEWWEIRILKKDHYEYRGWKNKFHTKFYVAKKLSTGTQCLLGADWFRVSHTILKFSPEGVDMTIGEQQQKLTLVKSSTKCISNTMVAVYDTKENKKEEKEAKIAEVRTIDPYVSLAVKCTLNGKE